MIVNSKLFKSGTLIFLCLVIPFIAVGQNTDPAASTQSSRAANFDDLKRFLQNFNESYRDAREIGNQYRLTRVLMQDQIRDLQSVVPVNQPKIVQIESKIKALKKQEKVAQSNLKKFRKYANALSDINDQTLKKQQKIMAAVESGYQKMPRVFAPGSIKPLPANERPIADTTNPKKERTKKEKTPKKTKGSGKTKGTKKTKRTATARIPNKAKANKRPPRPATNIPAPIKAGYATYDRSKDVNYNPPSSECSYQFKGMDEFLGKEKTEVQPNLFFFHTDPELRKYMKGKEYIECSAGLANTYGGVTTLNIEVYIRSQNALREFGGLQKGNAMTIKLVNGSIVKLLSINSDNGTFDQTTGLATFRNQFLVQKGEENALKESEIDKIRLVWSNGYEDYDVYQVDFMMKQLNCLYAN